MSRRLGAIAARALQELQINNRLPGRCRPVPALEMPLTTRPAKRPYLVPRPRTWPSRSRTADAVVAHLQRPRRTTRRTPPQDPRQPVRPLGIPGPSPRRTRSTGRGAETTGFAVERLGWMTADRTAVHRPLPAAAWAAAASSPRWPRPMSRCPRGQAGALQDLGALQYLSVLHAAAHAGGDRAARAARTAATSEQGRSDDPVGCRHDACKGKAVRGTVHGEPF